MSSKISLASYQPISAREATWASPPGDASTTSTPAPHPSTTPRRPRRPGNRPHLSPSTPIRDPGPQPLSSSLSSSLKAKSIAQLSPTTAYPNKGFASSSSSSNPGNKYPRLLSSLLGSLRKPKHEKPEVQHLGIGLPSKLEYPLSEELLEELHKLELKVHDILVKNESVHKKIERPAKEEEDDNYSDDAKLNPSEWLRSQSPSPRPSPSGVEKEVVSPASLIARFASADERTSRGPSTPERTVGQVRIAVGELGDLNPTRTSSSSSSSTDTGSPRNFSTKCPRIHKDEELKDYAHRVANVDGRIHTPSSIENVATPTAHISNLDGADEYTLPCPPSIGKMNNFSNFDASNMNARQAPAQPQGQQMNGMNGVQQWPNVGAQSDMNVLWEYIVKLSDMHEQIRSQTQNVAAGMQQIDSMRANGTTSETVAAPHINGVNGLPPATTESTEITRLQTETFALQTRIEDLSTYANTLQNLNTDYENAISHTLDRLRPFAQSHSQALLAQKAHYLHLLEAERKENLELRLEQSRWQEKARDCKEMVVDALRAQGEMETGYVNKIAALRSDNRSLRRICGVPLMEESEDEGDGGGVGGMESAKGLLHMNEGARQGLEASRQENENAPADREGRRMVIN